EDFDVDHFVSDCRKRVQLEALRDDLELYYKLKTAMVELINKDYAGFVNLSTNLINVPCSGLVGWEDPEESGGEGGGRGNRDGEYV
ncbi:hypothetical protein FD755_025707, partial [Muntiacus reevesi]